MTDTPTIQPLGATPGGLPYPEDSDAVMNGAQAIKALALAVEAKAAPGSPGLVYEGLRALGATQVPLAFTYDPEFGGGVHTYACTSGRLQMVAFMVARPVTCTGVGMVTDTVGTAYPGTVYNGCGLWQYAANGDCIFLRDTGATNGAMWTATGLQLRPWTTPITLQPGIVYVVGFQQQTNAGTNAVIRGISGSQANATIPAASTFQRSFGVAAPGSTQAAVMKTWPAGSFTPYANLPWMVLY